jgi:hypothetical protein
MSTTNTIRPEQSTVTSAPARPWLLAMTIAIVVGLVVGGVTAYAQGWLSGGTSSLANSAGPWSLAAFAVARYARRPVTACAAAVLTLASCELGYVIATEIRGGSNASSTIVFWLTASVLAGVPLGLAGSLSTMGGVRRSVGVAVIAGVLIGEGVYGWTEIADTTDWRYWAMDIVVGVAIIACTASMSRPLVYHCVVLVTVALMTAVVVYGSARLV